MKRIGAYFIFIFVLTWSHHAFAQLTLPTFSLGYKSIHQPQDFVNSIKILLGLTVLALAPAILIMMTAFTRVVIVLSFVRQALGTQNMPPNQVIVGLALFITFFIMSPFLQNINTSAVQPYLNKQITQEVALDRALVPIRQFMFNETRDSDLALFVHLSKMPQPKTRADVPTTVLIPAFITSELKTAFEIGFIIYLPFLIIDMIVASVLMAMGMMMLPPVIISLPFKIMLFVLVNGWALIIGSLVKSFG